MRQLTEIKCEQCNEVAKFVRFSTYGYICENKHFTPYSMDKHSFVAHAEDRKLDKEEAEVALLPRMVMDTEPTTEIPEKFNMGNVYLMFTYPTMPKLQIRLNEEKTRIAELHKLEREIWNDRNQTEAWKKDTMAAIQAEKDSIWRRIHKAIAVARNDGNEGDAVLTLADMFRWENMQEAIELNKKVRASRRLGGTGEVVNIEQECTKRMSDIVVTSTSAIVTEDGDDGFWD